MKNKEINKIIRLFAPKKPNPEYTWESFITDENNKWGYYNIYHFLHGETSNPYQLLIYGEKGVGKTHLLHAFANEKNLVVLNATRFVRTCDKLLNEMKEEELIEFLKENFKVLLLDNIHAIGLRNITPSKERIVNFLIEFFSFGKYMQIVATFDGTINEVYMKYYKPLNQTILAWALIGLPPLLDAEKIKRIKGQEK